MKKTRLALMFVLMLLCVGLAFSLTSCGDDDNEHIHTPNSAVRENEIAATCASAGSYDDVVYCADCSEEISRTTKAIEKLSHTPSEWITDTEATCKAEGTKHKECTECHTVLENGTIDKLTTHTPAEAVRENEVAAKCNALGSYDAVIYCSVCEIELSRVEKEISKKNHTPSGWITDTEATCKVEGTKHKECTVCHAELEMGKIDKLTTHTPAEAIRENEVDSSCSKLGSYNEVVYCSVCEIELSREEKEIGKLPHTEVVDKAKAPTCTETGLTEGKHCSVCSTVLVAQETVDALGHTEVTDEAKAPTCTETGLTEGKHCSICSTVLVAQEVVKANGHTEVVDNAKAPTCTETGLTEGMHCSVCSTVLVAQEVVKANGHTEVVDNAKAPNCTETGLTEGKHCSVCSTVLVAQETVDALGHTEVVDNAKAPNCTETGLTEGKHCSVCSTVLVKQEIVDALGHTEVIDNAKAPTCTETGLTEGKHCSVCSTVLVKQEPVDALGHTEVIDEAVEATDTSDGLTEGKHCEVCGEILVAQQVIPARLQGTAIKSELLMVDGDRIYGSVSNTTTIFSFLNDITVNDNATYVLARDIGCENTIASKTVTLNVGDNTFYIFVTNGKAQKLYTVTVHRLAMYTVSFDTKGGTALDSLTIEEGSTVSATVSEKVGYNFDGWIVNGNTVSFPYTVTANVELEALFSPKVYDIAYETFGGVNAEGNPASYTIETSTITLGTSTRDYYDFCGWYDNADFTGNAVKEITIGSIGDVKLYAKWTPTVYEIKYNLNNSENGDGNPESYTVESSTIILAEPTRIGYDFKGWFTNEECTDGITEISHGTHGNVEVWAKWTPTIYNVKYNLGGGENHKDNPATYTIESTTITLAEPTRTGYTFEGWYANSALNGEVFEIAAGSHENIEVWAKWIPIVYDITYNLNDGENHDDNPATYTIESETIIFAEPKRAGYDFIGWYTDEEFNTEIKEIANGSYGDVVIYAKWEALFTVVGNSITGFTEYGKVNVTDLNIPTAIDGVQITNIDGQAFYGCTSLTSVTIGDNVTSIGRSAFFGCTGLTNVYIADIARWCDISFGNSYSNPLYYANNLYLNGELITELVIPNGVTMIPFHAFSCNNIESITIPDSVTSISSYAFEGCTSLTSITIPDSVTSISSYAFEGCTSLTSITIPNSVTSISSYAFNGCASLTSITIPDSVTSISSYAFERCTSLTSIAIPDSVTSIGSYAFWECTSLTSVYISNITRWCDISFGNSYANPLCYANNLYLNGELITELVIPNGVTMIPIYAFSCKNIESVTIPDSVTSIGGSAFSGCTSLTSIAIPDSVTSIGGGTFCNCTSLISVTIGNGVTSIGDSAFSGCTSLTGITIPDSVISIGFSAFSDCTSLTNMTIPSSVTSIGSSTFWNCTSLIIVTIGNGVTSIDDHTFTNCTSLTSVSIPDSVTSIGNYAFSDCTSLTNMTIPSSVTSIGNWVFSYCTNLASIVIPDRVASIGSYAFLDCGSLTNVTVGNSVTKIGKAAFERCHNITSVYYHGTESEWSATTIESGNTYLTSATRYLYSENEPTLNADGTAYDGNYWHYNENSEIVEWAYNSKK